MLKWLPFKKYTSHWPTISCAYTRGIDTYIYKTVSMIKAVTGRAVHRQCQQHGRQHHMMDRAWLHRLITKWAKKGHIDHFMRWAHMHMNERYEVSVIKPVAKRTLRRWWHTIHDCMRCSVINAKWANKWGPPWKKIDVKAMSHGNQISDMSTQGT